MPNADHTTDNGPGEAGAAVLSKTEFARLNNWSKSYVSKLAGDGRLDLTDDGKVRVAESLARIAATTNAPERASAPALPPPVRADRDRKEFYDAENARLDLEQRLGKLLDRAEVISVIANAAVTLRTRLEAWPQRLAPQLAALTGNEQRIRAVLVDQVEAALTELSRNFGKLADLGKTGAPGSED